MTSARPERTSREQTGPEQTRRHLAWLAALKLAAVAVAALSGFRAVSDDDYARVTIAQAFAHAPKLDPTGTSWLPAPFYLTGGAMLVFGRSLLVGWGVAIALGVASAALVYVAARRLVGDPRAAFVGAALAAVFPWSARLGLAPVPELPTAALSVLALSTLVAGRPSADAPGEAEGSRAPLYGGLALLFATLSRYEPWSLALFFALALAARAVRARSRHERLVALGGVALAGLGPALWLAHNRLAHGDWLAFAHRVAAYKKALEAGSTGSAELAQLFGYPAALLQQEPELVVASLLVLGAATRSPALRAALGGLALPGALAALQLVALSAALARDAAPTHHPERAGLVVLTLASLAVGVGAVRLAASPAGRRRTWLALGVALCMFEAGFLLRRRYPPTMAPRAAERAAGARAGALLRPGERLLIEGRDYGYFAVIAAFERPEDALVDRDLDPRKGELGSSFESDERLLTKLRETGARAFVSQRAPSFARCEPGREGHREAEGELFTCLATPGP
jgi:hypothetical protein